MNATTINQDAVYEALNELDVVWQSPARIAHTLGTEDTIAIERICNELYEMGLAVRSCGQYAAHTPQNHEFSKAYRPSSDRRKTSTDESRSLTFDASTAAISLSSLYRR